ncbi:hypothetical protein POTOM_049847 [Populus tomentosa]|uniref:Uncharacterized protein n=1 Tax=Populus tomentosa TaxID=118781 RepID=A0A8X7Y6Q1_POPTO|nr:hypothetical protein POTOM_049847 [Populus tomentosa]
MGRGKVVLERIENKISRQVTFSKRRNGLLKKAYELSLLCDAEVALIIFSSRGKLFEFCSSTDINKTLQRYQQCCYSTEGTNIPEDGSQTLYQEVSRLRARCESLQRSQRNFLGEELEPLTVKELKKIEKQLDKTLSEARKRKVHTRTRAHTHIMTQLMFDRVEELRKRLEEAQRLPAIHGVGDPSKGDGNRQSMMHPSKFNYVEPQPSLQMDQHQQFVSQEQGFDYRTSIRGKNKYPTPKWFP